MLSPDDSGIEVASALKNAEAALLEPDVSCISFTGGSDELDCSLLNGDVGSMGGC